MDFEATRAKLIQSLDSEISDKRVLAAMSRIPRERFIPENRRIIFSGTGIRWVGYRVGAGFGESGRVMDRMAGDSVRGLHKVGDKISGGEE